MKALKYKWLTFLLALGIMINSCSHFEEMNISPNQPSNVPTSALLTQAQYSLVANLFGEISQLGAQYIQYFSQLTYPEKSFYAGNENSDFSAIYQGGIKDLEEIIRLNQDDLTKADKRKYGDNENQIAVAKIMQAWAYHSVTDIWGDVPFSESLKSEIIAPKYDTQEEIYDGLITLLQEAQNMINKSPSVSLKGDQIFNGDMDQWDSFAESLIIRIAMRMSESNSAKASQYIQNADFSKAFNTSAHKAQFVHLETEAEANPLYYDNVIDPQNDYFACSNVLIDTLLYLNDPRISSYANTAVSSGTYVGHPYGRNIVGVDVDVSLPGDKYAGQTAPSILMTAAEILFIRAEAAQRGYIAGGATSAAQYYQDAIRASMEYNGVSSVDIDDYLAQSTVQYDAANWRQLIGLQKWIALYNQGVQAWSEWRRLDYPDLKLAPDAVTTMIPRRRAYPTYEYSTNKANVELAVDRLATKEDKFTEKVWWDK